MGKLTAYESVEAFSLRIPQSLRDQVRRSATANRRSLNAEMLVLMETALNGSGRAVTPEAFDRMLSIAGEAV